MPRRCRGGVKAHWLPASAPVICWAASSLNAERLDALRTAPIEQQRRGRPQAQCHPERHIPARGLAKQRAERSHPTDRNRTAKLQTLRCGSGKPRCGRPDGVARDVGRDFAPGTLVPDLSYVTFRGALIHPIHQVRHRQRATCFALLRQRRAQRDRQERRGCGLSSNATSAPLSPTRCHHFGAQWFQVLRRDTRAEQPLEHAKRHPRAWPCKART